MPRLFVEVNHVLHFSPFCATFSRPISIHEAVSHLSYTHVVLEAPMVSMNRQLAKEHPIHALFAPHVEGTALINWGAHEVGVGPEPQTYAVACCCRREYIFST